MTQDIKDRPDFSTPGSAGARILPWPQARARMQVREREGEADDAPAFRSVPAETDLLANTARPNIDPADLAVLLRDLRRLSEVCTRSHLDQAAALIEVAALVVETQSRLAPLIDLSEEPSDLGLL